MSRRNLQSSVFSESSSPEDKDVWLFRKFYIHVHAVTPQTELYLTRLLMCCVRAFKFIIAFVFPSGCQIDATVSAQPIMSGVVGRMCCSVAIPLCERYYCDVMKFVLRKHQVPFHLIQFDNEEAVLLPQCYPAPLADYQNQFE